MGNEEMVGMVTQTLEFNLLNLQSKSIQELG